MGMEDQIREMMRELGELKMLLDKHEKLAEASAIEIRNLEGALALSRTEYVGLADVAAKAAEHAETNCGCVCALSVLEDYAREREAEKDKPETDAEHLAEVGKEILDALRAKFPESPPKALTVLMYLTGLMIGMCHTELEGDAHSVITASQNRANEMLSGLPGRPVVMAAG